MPLWYHPPPVLVEDGISATPGAPPNPPLYYHPPPVCVDPLEDVVVPPERAIPTTSRVTSPHAPVYLNTSPKHSSLAPREVPCDRLSGLPPFPLITPEICPRPYQGDMPSYPKESYRSYATGCLNPNIALKPAVGYSNQLPQGPHAPIHTNTSCMTPGPLHNEFLRPPRFDNATTNPQRSGERIYYYDNEANETHISGPGISTKCRVQSGNFGSQSHPCIPRTNSACRSIPFCIDENNSHKVTTAPQSPHTQHKSRHLELTRDFGGELEVKLWDGDESRGCGKKVRVFSGPSSSDVDITLNECQACDGHGNEGGLFRVKRKPVHDLIVGVEKLGGRSKQPEEHKLKEKIRGEEYAKMKADEKLKLEIRKELEREDAQRQEVARMQKLEVEKQMEIMKAESRAAAEFERGRIRKEVDIEVKKCDEARIAELEAGKVRRLHMEHMIREETRQCEFAIEMEKRRREHLADIEQEKRRRLEDKAREEARQQELMVQAERERICHEVSAELDKREKVRLAEIEAEKKRNEAEERAEEEARNLKLSIEVENRRIANLAELAAKHERKAEEQKRAGEEAYQCKLDQEYRQKVDEINKKRVEEDRIRSEEWEKIRVGEIQRIREEIRKELNEEEARRIEDERIKYETLGYQQIEADRIKLDQRVRNQVEAGREELKKELKRELKKEEEDKALRIQVEVATLKAKVRAEALAKEQACIRSFAEAQERKRIERNIAQEEATKKQQQEKNEIAKRKQAQAQETALEQKRLEEESMRVAAIAATIAEESEMRRIIRAEIKEDMRKSRMQKDLGVASDGQVMGRLLPHRERCSCTGRWVVRMGLSSEQD